MAMNWHEFIKRLLPANHANSREKILLSHRSSSIYIYSSHSRANPLLPIQIRIHACLRDPNDQSQVEKQQRRCEKQAIKKIKRAANSREQISRVLYVSAALDN